MVTLNINFLSKHSSGQNKLQSGPAEPDTSLVINNRQPAQSISWTNWDSFIMMAMRWKSQMFIKACMMQRLCPKTTLAQNDAW